MKIGIYPAALHVMGGGEKYIGKIAEILSKNNDVTLLLLTQPDVQELQKRLNINLSRVAFEPIRRPLSVLRSAPVLLKSMNAFLNAYEFFRLTRKYDVFINQERETYIPSHSPMSFLICEVPPVRNPRSSNLFERLFLDPKLKTYDEIVVNSYFTKRWAEKYYSKEATVLYPPIDTESFVPSAKEHIILSVGRFWSDPDCKKQLEMVKSFKKLYIQHELKGWTYHLVGGLGNAPKDQKYLDNCREEGKGYPVYFHVNVPFETLKELYGKAAIFWHATGLGEDENKHPERMEHFGMTTVEAMSAGCVPVVINKGGQTEIVENGINGFLFETLEELNKHSIRLVDDEVLWKKMSEACIRRSQEFSLDKFETRVREIFKTWI